MLHNDHNTANLMIAKEKDIVHINRPQEIKHEMKESDRLPETVTARERKKSFNIRFSKRLYIIIVFNFP